MCNICFGVSVPITDFTKKSNIKYQFPFIILMYIVIKLQCGTTSHYEVMVLYFDTESADVNVI